MLSAEYIHINMDKNKLPKLYTLPDTLQVVQHPPPSRSSRCSVSSVRARVVPCMVCPGTCPALALTRPALLSALCSRSGCAGAGVSTGGVYGERRGWGRSCPR